jgi:hypothetical protein
MTRLPATTAALTIRAAAIDPRLFEFSDTTESPSAADLGLWFAIGLQLLFVCNRPWFAIALGLQSPLVCNDRSANGQYKGHTSPRERRPGHMIG